MILFFSWLTINLFAFSFIFRKIHKEFSLQTEISAGYHAHTADVPVTVSENQLNICSKDTALCAFALLDEDFPCNKSSRPKEERNAFKEEAVKLTESVAPIARTLLKKKMKIIGWSQNLLQNASGEVIICFFSILTNVA